MLAGPYASMIMGDLGAEVIKIEPPEGDSTRGIPPYFYGKDSAYFWSVNRNKKSIVIDLKHIDGLKLFYELISHADVVLDNFSPGVMQRLKIDYGILKTINTKIICCSISSFGEDGPYRNRPGYDLIVQAISGGMSITGELGREPVRAGIPIGDLMGGVMAVHGILAALISRARTGHGEKIDLSLLDGQMYLLTYIAQYYFYSNIVPGPIGSGHQSNVIYQALRTKDIRIVVAAIRDHHFQKFCKAIGKEEWGQDERFATRPARLKNRSLLTQMIEEILMTKSGDEWLAKLHEAGVPAGAINTMDRALNDPQVIAREMVVEVDGPAKEKVKIIGNPFKLTEMKNKAIIPPPPLGEHTKEVLQTILNYSPQKIDSLAKDGVIKVAEQLLKIS